jgi:hypothetical protein
VRHVTWITLESDASHGKRNNGEVRVLIVA